MVNGHIAKFTRPNQPTQSFVLCVWSLANWVAREIAINEREKRTVKEVVLVSVSDVGTRSCNPVQKQHLTWRWFPINISFFSFFLNLYNLNTTFILHCKIQHPHIPIINANPTIFSFYFILLLLSWPLSLYISQSDFSLRFLIAVISVPLGSVAFVFDSCFFLFLNSFYHLLS